MQQRLMTAALLALCVIPAPALAQQRAVAAPAQSQSLVAGVPDSAVLASLRLRNIGPAVMSGRISEIAVPTPAAGERWGRVVYIASAGGGAWKTTNAGVTWQPISDDVPAGSIGAIAVAPSDSNVVFLGTGESNNLRSSSWGIGLYKSTDGGRTWARSGLERSQHIARIVVHPRNANTVFVAAMGPLWGPGGERGIFRSTDGGRTWTNVKAINETTGFTDIAFDPVNPDIMYAASYQRERRAWSFVAGGAGTGIWKSTDGGTTWTAISNGLPQGDKGRIGIAVAQSQPRTLYATIDHATASGVYRSDDAGATWTRQSGLTSIPFFFGQIRVDTKNPERVYHLGQNLSVSEDGARTWRTIAGGTHADHHAMWIDPTDPSHMIIGNDGGLFFSHDRGQTWDFAMNLPVSTFYAVTVDMRDPYWIFGGLQDNGSWGVPSSTRYGGILNTDWVRVGGGDGFYAQVDPTDHNVVYAESQEGGLLRRDLATDESKSIRPPNPAGADVRYNWSAPLLISPHDNRTLYLGANMLFRSPDRGDSWTPLGGDLTRNLDRDTLPIMGLRAAGGHGRHQSTARYGNIATIDESKRRKGLLYVGTDDGVVAISENDGAAWRRIERFTGVPELTYVSRVIASQHADATAYVTLDGHRNNDFKPYVLKTTDMGRTWTNITGNLPEMGSVQVIREHHRNPNVLFVGTEFGAFVTVNGGGYWSQLPYLPPVAVHDMVIHPRANDLVIATHGRGIWVLDDIGPLERLAEAAQARVAYVFPPRPAATQNRGGGPTYGPGARRYVGTNPPSGAALSYLVKPGLAQGARLSLAILDAQGQPVRELTAQARPGLHRATWDLRYQPIGPATAQGGQIAGRAGGAGRGGGGADEEEDQPGQRGGGGGGGGIAGPYVVPGDYRVQLRQNDAVLNETRITVQRDPAVRLSDAEFRDLTDARMRAYTLARDARALALQLDSARARLARARQAADSSSAGARDAQSLDGQLAESLTRLCGSPAAAGCGDGGGGGRGGRGGGGGRGGRGGGAAGGSPPIFGRATEVMGAIGTNHFLPTPAHRQTLSSAAADFEQERGRAQQALGRVDTVIRALGR
jgi:photosystem II stability/assembly factor-like uncharacterized protein